MMLKEYDDKLINIFGISTFQTISKSPNVFRVNFESNSLDEVNEEANGLVKKLFEDDEFLIRITFWYRNEKEKYLSNCIVIEDFEDYSVGVFKFKSSDSEFKEFIKEHLNYEKAEEPSVNVTAFIFDINKRILLNIYDDRGADYLMKL